MYSKLIFDDFSNIEDDSLFDKLNEGSLEIHDIQVDEMLNLSNQEVEVVDMDNFIIMTPNFEINHKVLPFQLKACNKKGVLECKATENLFTVNNETLSLKAKIICKYLKENNCKIVKIFADKNIITCFTPYDNNQTDPKSYIVISNFNFKSHSETDRQDKNRKKWVNKASNDLKKLWKENDEKDEFLYNNNPKYFDKVIKDKFPPIIKQKGTGILFIYEDGYYREMKDDEIFSDYVKIINETMFHENGNLLSISELKQAISYIKNTYKFQVRSFESSDYYNCKNGILNLKTLNIIPHSSDYFFNYKSDINYKPNVCTKTLDTFIKEVITDNNPVDIFKKILGHIHFQGEKAQFGFLFKGTKKGGNGKGTLTKLIQYVIGSLRTLNMHLSKIEKSDFMTYQFKDKALYVEDDYKLDFITSNIVEFLNSLIGGAHEIVHQKNKPPVCIKHTAIPIIQCNKIPKLKAGDDGGFYRRWVIVNFGNEIKDVKALKASNLLNNEDVKSSLLNYLIEGYMMVKNQPDILKDLVNNDQVEEWKIENNQVIQYVKDNIKLEGEISSRELYLHYKNWNLGGSHVSETKFIKELKEQFNLITKRKLVDGNKLTFLEGISIA